MSALSANRQHPPKITEIQHVGMALGVAMGVACWEVIGYHIKNPHPFSFQRYYMKCVFGVHPVVNAPENPKDYTLTIF